MKTAARVVYGIFGTLVIGLSLIVLFRPGVALHSEEFNPLTAHLTQEQGAEGLFIGLMSFWCLFNFGRRRWVHLGLCVFTFAFSAIHWGEYFRGARTLTSPLVNSVPFVMFLVTAPFRTDTRG